jgi:hypothetical protein
MCMRQYNVEEGKKDTNGHLLLVEPTDVVRLMFTETARHERARIVLAGAEKVGEQVLNWTTLSSYK